MKKIKFNFAKKKIQINLSNKLFYTLVVVGILILSSVVVYAIVPNPGHAVSEVDWSGTISQLNTNSLCLTGDCKSAWPSGGGDSLWTQGTGEIYYDSGNVRIGSNSQTKDLDVSGSVRIKGGLYAGSGVYVYEIVNLYCEGYDVFNNYPVLEARCVTLRCENGKYHNCEGPCTESVHAFCPNSLLGVISHFSG